MSRNLARTDCRYCQCTVVLVEKPRPITKADANAYIDEYEGMLVANAVCGTCDAQYLAWVDEGTRTRRRYGHRAPGPGETHVDLSFRSTFNDEPGIYDVPRYRITKETVVHRHWWPSHPCGHPKFNDYDPNCYECRHVAEKGESR